MMDKLKSDRTVVLVGHSDNIGGLEDNIRFDKTRLASSNADLVSRLADICKQYDRRPATPAEAREILSLPPAE